MTIINISSISLPLLIFLPKFNFSLLPFISIMIETESSPQKLDTHHRFTKILEALNVVSHNFDPLDSDSSAIKALLELRTASSSILSTYPRHSSLSQHLSELSDLVQDLQSSKSSSHGLKSFLFHLVKSHEIKRLAGLIESELQELIDQETVSCFTVTVADMRCSLPGIWQSSDVDKLFDKMTVLQERLVKGFDIDLQHLLLKSGLYSELEWVLCNPLFSETVREKAAVLMKELVLFNKDVFVGNVLVGGSVKALVSMGSSCSLQILSVLIRAIRSPLVDELLSCGGIVKIVGYLSAGEMEMRIAAMNCAMEIGYYGRKEAVEAMINCGFITRLVVLQRLEFAGNVVGKDKYTDNHPFAGCVARFAVQLQVGEGLRQREKRAFKQQILSNIREACLSDAECATIVAEVLWGSTP